MKNGQKSSLYGETSLYSEEIPYSELFSKIHYIEYPLYQYISWAVQFFGQVKFSTVDTLYSES